MKKTAVRDQILVQLRADHALQTRAAQTSRDEAISEESRPENQYDMHSQEAAYLAEGQARLAAEIAESIKLYEALPIHELDANSGIAVGALVRVDHASAQAWYFLGPRSGGLEILIDGVPVLVVTPSSPLGRELLGKRPGDDVRPPGPRSAQPHQIAVIA